MLVTFYPFASLLLHFVCWLDLFTILFILFVIYLYHLQLRSFYVYTVALLHFAFTFCSFVYFVPILHLLLFTPLYCSSPPSILLHFIYLLYHYSQFFLFCVFDSCVIYYIGCCCSVSSFSFYYLYLLHPQFPVYYFYLFRL